MSSNSTRLTALKVGYKGEIHRIRIDLAQFNLNELHAVFQSTFKLAPATYVIQYRDNEGDCLNVTNDSEYAEACRVFAAENETSKSLRFFAISKTHAAFKENVADPILKAIEKLVESLNNALNKVKREEWSQKAQEGIETTTVALNKALQEARVSFESAKKQIKELPYEQIVKETTEGIKLAAEDISVFAQELVAELRNLSFGDETTENATETEEVVQDNASDATVESEVESIEETVVVPPIVEETTEVKTDEPAETLQHQNSDNEWEQVSESLSESPVVVSPPASPSPAEMKWAAQLTLVREVFPEADVSRTIELLEQARGNIHVVMNMLAEV